MKELLKTYIIFMVNDERTKQAAVTCPEVVDFKHAIIVTCSVTVINVRVEEHRPGQQPPEYLLQLIYTLYLQHPV